MKRNTSIFLWNYRTVMILTLFLLTCSGVVGASLSDYHIAPANTFPTVQPGASTRLIVPSDMLGHCMIVDVSPPSYDPSAPHGLYIRNGKLTLR